MISNYHSYKIDIEDSVYRTDSGTEYKRSAIITFLDKEGNELEIARLGVPDMSELYETIHSGNPLVLDSCYVHGFSLSAYRKLYELGKNDLVTINSLSARYAFFDSQVSTDFTYGNFSDGVSFDGAHFGKSKLLFNNSRFSGNVDFSGVVVRSGHIEFTGSQFGKGDFIFKNAFVLDGLKDFSDVKFGQGDITFANTEFNCGDLLFINTQFNDGKFNFKITRITSGRVDFHYAIFGAGEIVFERAEFGDSRVDFRAVDFGEGRVNFNRSVFGDGELNFEGASCRRGKIQFKRASIGTGTKNFRLLEMAETEFNFERTQFGTGDMSFDGSRFDKLILRSCYLNNYVDLRIASADVVDLSDTIVRDIIDFETYNHNIEINTLDMTGMRLIGKLFIDWELNGCKRMICSQPETNNRQKAEQFRILKVNFNQTGKYEEEDKAYIMFKRYEAKALVDKYSDRGIVMKILAWISNGFRWLVFDAAGLYATNPLRVLFSMGVGYVVFSLLFLLLIKVSDADIISSTTDQLADLPRAFYHSAITFFTIGYGDHYPHGSIRIVSGLEGFVGVFLMSYFTVAFVRKVLR
ncbi:MAG: two pore domain potassium channel family protein [Bacteroidales bacterium]|nr:two pore domain potassium channel family protein [Bacteroidales bacterium]